MYIDNTENGEIEMTERKLPNFYAPRTGEEKFNARRYMQDWEQAKIAVRCPSAREARRTLGLSVKQFAELLEVSERTVNRLDVGMLELTFAQKMLIVKALDIARKKGFLSGDDEK